MDELKKQLTSEADALLKEQDMVLLRGGNQIASETEHNGICIPFNFHFGCGSN